MQSCSPRIREVSQYRSISIGIIVDRSKLDLAASNIGVELYECIFTVLNVFFVTRQILHESWRAKEVGKDNSSVVSKLSLRRSPCSIIGQGMITDSGVLAERGSRSPGYADSNTAANFRNINSSNMTSLDHLQSGELFA